MVASINAQDKHTSRWKRPSATKTRVSNLRRKCACVCANEGRHSQILFVPFHAIQIVCQHLPLGVELRGRAAQHLPRRERAGLRDQHVAVVVCVGWWGLYDGWVARGGKNTPMFILYARDSQRTHTHIYTSTHTYTYTYMSTLRTQSGLSAAPLPHARR